MAESETATIFQHPLAYLLGLEGIALLRGFAGEYDRDFTLARLAEIRSLLDSAERFGDGVEVRPISSDAAYADWAEFYDQSDNELVRTEQPVVRAVLDALPVGTALDAACGTARHGRYLASLGHRVIGVDSSVAMLEQARAKLPAGEFRQATLQTIPLDDDRVDLIVCGLALMHVPELEPVFAEFARVLRPGGDLVISDWRGVFATIVAPFVKLGPDGTPGYAPTIARETSEYLTVALDHGFQLRFCAEPYGPDPLVDSRGVSTGDDEEPAHVPGEVPNRWALHRFAPKATNAANHRRRHALVLHFQLTDAVGEQAAAAATRGMRT